ncbi:MAG: hypothetical protein J6M46_03260, partial [Lachnospiraceae bacterium]|nr:hypothetical protein [Lachnospiraceae bacterium]
KGDWGRQKHHITVEKESGPDPERKAGHPDPLQQSDERRNLSIAWEESEMTTILEGAGIMMVLLGAAAADSPSLTVPVVIMGIGIMLMYVGYKNERRWY